MFNYLYDHASRSFEILLGAVLCLLGGIFALVGVAWLFAIIGSPEHFTVLLWLGGITFAIGFFSLRLAVMLLRGKGRHGTDQLFSPWTLWFWGFLFLLSSFAAFLHLFRNGGSPWGIVTAVFIAIGCFRLAIVRQREKETKNSNFSG